MDSINDGVIIGNDGIDVIDDDGDCIDDGDNVIDVIILFVVVDVAVVVDNDSFHKFKDVKNNDDGDDDDDEYILQNIPI